LVILILFGSKKIPEFMKGIGKGIHEFKKSTNNLHDDISKSSDEDDKKT
jgi:sec-independent protein translocase protein TatA